MATRTAAVAPLKPRAWTRPARPLLTGLAVAIAASLALTGAAMGISGGKADDGAHPQVGAIVVPRDGGGYDQYCTGTLIHSRVLLTAAHCILGVTNGPDDEILVTFDERIISGSTVHAGVGTTHPGYRGAHQHDMGVVVFDDPISGISPATLPALGLLDQLNKQKKLRKTLFTIVGYGSEAQKVEAGYGPTFPGTNERRYAVVAFSALDKQFLHETQNKAQGYAGACYGDSGGPSFIHENGVETTMLVGVTTTGDGPCYATNVAARTDTKSARSFLNGVLAGVGGS
jgi:V8-like Glu-specific endopeptidase